MGNPSPSRKAFPSNMPRPCRMRGLQLVYSWSSRPGEPLACLPKCFEGVGEKEVACWSLRCPRGGLQIKCLICTPPLGGGLWVCTCAVWCWLMHGSYGQGEGTNSCRLRVFSSDQAPWRVLLQACRLSSGSSMSSRAT
jgi:hypothetical protein